MEQEHRADYGDNGHKVNVDAGFHGAKQFNGIVPGEEANRGGGKPQKQHVQQIIEFGKAFKSEAEIGHEKQGHHEQKSVEENPSCNSNGIISVVADFFCYKRVNCPNSGLTDCQNIAERMELKPITSGKAHKCYTGYGGNEADEKAGFQRFLLRDEARENRREKGRNRNGNPDV